MVIRMEPIMVKTFKQFLVENQLSEVQVTVTGKFNKEKFEHLVHSANLINRSSAKILTQTTDKATISFQTKDMATVFINLCKLDHIRCFISKSHQWTAYEVIKDILDGLAWDQNYEGSENMENGYYHVSHPWVAISEKGMFSDMDSPPGSGGAIGLPDIHGTSPEALAAAAHEAYHAYAHKHNLTDVRRDEKWTNDMAEKWLKQHLSGETLKQAIDYINMSRNSHGLPLG